MNPHVILTMAVSLCIFILRLVPLPAQPIDDLQRRVSTILAPFDTNNLGRAGRRFIIDRLDRESIRWIPEVVEYIDQREGTSWVSPSTRTLLMMLIEREEELELSVLAESPSRIMYRAEGAGVLDPDPTPIVRDYARSSQRQIIRFLTQNFVDERHAEFLLLLYHSLIIRGVRGVDDLNTRVGEFASRDTMDPRSSLALHYLRRRVTSAPFGIGLVAGYDAGAFVAANERDAAGVHGPRIGFVALAGEGLLEITALTRSVEVGKPNGTSVEGALKAGYDLFESDLHLTPLAGIHFWSIVDEESVEQILTPVFGLDIGARLLFDDPPHLQLTVGAEWHLTSVIDASPRFDRQFWAIRFTLALVRRTFRIE